MELYLMIVGEKINLCTVLRLDLPEYFKMINDIQLKDSFSPIRFTSQMSVEKQFNKDGFLNDRFMVFLIKNKQNITVGSINIRKWHPILDSFEIGFIVKSEHRGKGFASESVALATDYLFKSNPVNLMIALTHSNNIAAQQVLKKSDYKKLALLPESCYCQGKFVDYIMFGLIRDK